MPRSIVRESHAALRIGGSEIPTMPIAPGARLVYTPLSVSVRLNMDQDGTMPVLIDGKMLYRIGEALAACPVSRATYFRWLKERKIADTQYRDRNGRRLFTEAELDELKQKAQKLIEAPQTRLRFDE